MLELDDIAAEVLRSRIAPRRSSVTTAFRRASAPRPTTSSSTGSRTVTGCKDGDILSIDAGAIYEGYHGDAASPSPSARSLRGAGLIDATEQALWAGIAQVRPGARLGDIGSAVKEIGDGAGYGVVHEYVGHGIGRQMHEDPQVPNHGTPGKGLKLRTGMSICIEPMFNLGTADTRVMPDGWTVVTADGALSAHFEHTIALTEEGTRCSPWRRKTPPPSLSRRLLAANLVRRSAWTERVSCPSGLAVDSAGTPSESPSTTRSTRVGR